MSDEYSKHILKKVLSEFKISKDIPNQEYLEHQLNHLDRMLSVYKSQSADSKLSARNRAKARDMSQNCMGLINGIKFGISFWLHKDENLMEIEHIEKKKDKDETEKPIYTN